MVLSYSRANRRFQKDTAYTLCRTYKEDKVHFLIIVFFCNYGEYIAVYSWKIITADTVSIPRCCYCCRWTRGMVAAWFHEVIRSLRYSTHCRPMWSGRIERLNPYKRISEIIHLRSPITKADHKVPKIPHSSNRRARDPKHVEEYDCR
jgi:hypothetical protein